MRTSSEISAMSARSASALKRLDWFMSDANKDLKTKWAATEFVLSRLFIEPKAPLIDQSKHEHFTVEIVVENENQTSPEAGRGISKYCEI